MSTHLTEGGNPIDVCRRKALKVSVAALCSEVGFGSADDIALETLTEMLQSYITELGRNSRGYCELAGRTEVMVSDVSLALIEMGTNICTLPGYAKRPNKTVCLPPPTTGPGQQPRTLQAGQKKNHPSHVPEYLPNFPDPHTYIRTLTQTEPVTEYQIIREKAATQKRDVEHALTRFMAKTGDTETLFSDDPLAYPLIANKPKPLPYLDALMPKDQDLDLQEEHDFSNAPKGDAAEKKETEEDSKSTSSNQPSVPQQQPTPPAKQLPQPALPEAIQNTSIEGLDPDNQIDNPYLRPIKMPKLQKKRGKYL